MQRRSYPGSLCIFSAHSAVTNTIHWCCARLSVRFSFHAPGFCFRSTWSPARPPAPPYSRCLRLLALNFLLRLRLVQRTIDAMDMHANSGPQMCIPASRAPELLCMSGTSPSPYNLARPCSEPLRTDILCHLHVKSILLAPLSQLHRAVAIIWESIA
jgi:hypothetical protein